MKQEKLEVVDGLRNKNFGLALPVTEMAKRVVKTATEIVFFPIKAAENLARRRR